MGMAGIGAILGLVGSVASAGIGIMGANAQAKFMEAQAKNEQLQMNHMAGEERAAASRDAQAKDREASLLLSRQQAVAAASGAGATDPTVLELAGDVAREGSVQKRELMRVGLEKGQMLEYKGKVGVQMAKAEGKMLKAGAIGNAIGGVLGGLGSFAGEFSGSGAFAKYGGGGMPTASTLSGRTEVPPWYYA
jgi:hypothetical protein